VDVDATIIKERIERRISWIKHDASARRDYMAVQEMEELEHLFRMFLRKVEIKDGK